MHHDKRRILDELFKYISTKPNHLEVIATAIAERSCISFDIGPADQGELGFWYYDWYDACGPFECNPNEVHISLFHEVLNIGADEFQQYCHSYSLNSSLKCNNVPLCRSLDKFSKSSAVKVEAEGTTLTVLDLRKIGKKARQHNSLAQQSFGVALTI